MQCVLAWGEHCYTAAVNWKMSGLSREAIVSISGGKSSVITFSAQLTDLKEIEGLGCVERKSISLKRFFFFF